MADKKEATINTCRACGTRSQWPAGTPKTAIHCPTCAAPPAPKGVTQKRSTDKGKGADKRR